MSTNPIPVTAEHLGSHKRQEKWSVCPLYEQQQWPIFLMRGPSIYTFSLSRAAVLFSSWSGLKVRDSNRPETISPITNTCKHRNWPAKRRSWPSDATFSTRSSRNGANCVQGKVFQSVRREWIFRINQSC